MNGAGKISRRKFLVSLGGLTLGAGGLYAGYELSRTRAVETVQSISRVSSSVELTNFEFQVETFLENLEVPWSLAFSPDNRIFLTERPGRIRVMSLGDAEANIFAEIPTTPVGEGGLLGLALSPNFEDDHFVYVYYTYRKSAQELRNRVVRYTDENGVGIDPRVVLDDIPGAPYHDGGRIKFGPDRKLYIGTGDAGGPPWAQDLNSLAGKILRMNPDGSVPADNPFPNSLVYSYGHRNVQGLAWHPVTGNMYATEHGPSGEFGRFANDEINQVEPGGNYGWPVVICRGDDQRFSNPLYCTGDEETWAPSGCDFYAADIFPQWKNNFFVATLRGVHLHRFVINSETGMIEAHERLVDRKLGRLRDVVHGPDGSLYLLTSNRDGRGSPAGNDDRILRLVPAG